ncbi:MAG: Epoxyqueuosine reductase [Calditrichaeota bacterium]|nr:Epoxyqueuosine reductase [Calditrichota bacterium]
MSYPYAQQYTRADGELAARIKLAATSVGFDFAVIAPYRPPPRADYLRTWLSLGHAGGMEWLARNPERRIDPRELWPAGRSILSVGLAYDQPVPPDARDATDPSRGRFARYAWGRDYHDLMLPRLRVLLRAISYLAGRDVNGRAYVDTGPLLERPIAASAGAGFTGKHTLLIRHNEGSYFFLGELLLDLELPPDPERPVHFGCRDCHRCGDICPTGVLAEPYVNRAELCISYLTIEHRGQIPRELRPKLGNWVFGCDLCQETCPYNARDTAQTNEPWFEPQIPELGAPKLLDLFALDDGGFRAMFRKSAVKRTKRRGLLRNVAVALGNWGSDEAVPALAHALANEHEPLVRGHAAWALARIDGDSAAREALVRAWRNEPDPCVREEVDAALAGAG